MIVAKEKERKRTSPVRQVKQPTDEGLVHALGAGDLDVARSFFDAYLDRLYGLFRLVLDSRSEAQAALQATLQAAADRADQAPAGVDPGDWLLALALEQIALRPPSNGSPAPDAPPAESVASARAVAPAAELLRGIADPALSALVRTLEPRRRQALVLGVICKLDDGWVARAIGGEPGAVPALKRDAVAQLRQRLAEVEHPVVEPRTGTLASKPAPHLRPLPGPKSDGMLVVKGTGLYVEEGPGNSLVQAALRALERFLERLHLRHAHEHLDDDTAGTPRRAKMLDPTPTTQPIEKPGRTPSMTDYKQPEATAGTATHRTPRGTPSTERLSNPRRALGAGAATYGWTRRR